MRTSLLRLTLAASLAATTLTARADGFSTANVQLLQAFDLRDPVNGQISPEGDITTLTFNYFTTWNYGDLNMFVDFSRARGHFGSADGTVNDGDAKIYGEVQPRVGLGKVFGLKVPGFRDFGPAGELNAGNNFYAYLAGVGGDFALPGPYLAGLNVYYRYDKFVGDGWQATVYWGVPFKVGPVPFKLAGFADFAKALDANGDTDLDLVTQPQLLVDVGSLLLKKSDRLWVGTEYYVHLNPAKDTQSVQAMVQWTLR
jgi:nucleoside-specific outer membrane channel protein Tsx